jgi:MFS family permease
VTRAAARHDGDEQDRPRREPAWRAVAALGLAQIVCWGVVYYVFAVVQVPMREELGWTTAQTSGAFSLALLVSAVSGVAIGRWLDRHDPRPVLLGGPVVGALLVAAWSRVESIAAFYAVWIGMGLAMASTLYEPVFVVVAKRWHERRDRALTAITLMGGLASVVFLPLAQVLIDALGWRGAVLVLAATLGFAAVALNALALRDGAAGDAPAGVAGRSVSAGEALRTLGFWLLAAVFACDALTWAAVSVHLVPALRAHGHTAGFAALAAGLAGFWQLPGRAGLLWLSRALSPGALPAVILALGGVAALILAAAGGAAAVLVGVACFGVAHGMGTLVRPIVLADRYGREQYGAIASTAAMLATLSRALGPIAAAGVLSLTGGYDGVMLAIAALSAVAAGLALVAR